MSDLVGFSVFTVGAKMRQGGKLELGEEALF